VPEYRLIATFVLAAEPLLMWRARHFGEATYWIDRVLIIVVLSVLLVGAAAKWLGWISAPFEGALRFVSALLLWGALVAMSYRVSFIRAAA